MVSLSEAQHSQQILQQPCAEVDRSSDGVVVRCPFDSHGFGSAELGFGPYTGHSWELTVRDGEVVGARIGVQQHRADHPADDQAVRLVGRGEPPRRHPADVHQRESDRLPPRRGVCPAVRAAPRRVRGRTDGQAGHRRGDDGRVGRGRWRGRCHHVRCRRDVGRLRSRDAPGASRLVSGRGMGAPQRGLRAASDVGKHRLLLHVRERSDPVPRRRSAGRSPSPSTSPTERSRPRQTDTTPATTTTGRRSINGSRTTTPTTSSRCTPPTPAFAMWDPTSIELWARYVDDFVASADGYIARAESICAAAHARLNDELESAGIELDAVPRGRRLRAAAHPPRRRRPPSVRGSCATSRT